MRLPDSSSSSSHHSRTRQRPADALAAELGQSSLLLRHIALCRLVHARAYRSFSPAALRRVAGRIDALAEAGPAAALLEQLASLHEAELSCGSRCGGSAADAVEALLLAAVAQLAEHGYRTVHGAATCGRGQ